MFENKVCSIKLTQILHLLLGRILTCTEQTRGFQFSLQNANPSEGQCNRKMGDITCRQTLSTSLNEILGRNLWGPTVNMTQIRSQRIGLRPPSELVFTPKRSWIHNPHCSVVCCLYHLSIDIYLSIHLSSISLYHVSISIYLSTYHLSIYLSIYISIIYLCIIVVEPKFMCLMHSETKQTETSEFGAEKGLLQDQARRMGGSCSKNPNSLMVFGEKFL